MHAKLKKLIAPLLALGVLLLATAAVVFPGHYSFTGGFTFYTTNSTPVIRINESNEWVTIYDASGNNKVIVLRQDGTADFAGENVRIIDGVGAANPGKVLIANDLTVGGATALGQFNADSGAITTDGIGNLTALSFVGTGGASSFSGTQVQMPIGGGMIVYGDGSNDVVKISGNISGIPHLLEFYSFSGDPAGFVSDFGSIVAFSFTNLDNSFYADANGNVKATSFTGPGVCAARGVVQLVSGTNQVDTAFAHVANSIQVTPYVMDATNFTASVSNIVEGVSFTIFASTATTNKVSYAIFQP